MRARHYLFFASLFLSAASVRAYMGEEEARSWAQDVLDTNKPPEVGQRARYWSDIFLPENALEHFRGNPAEKEFLRANPASLLVIRNSACSALALSYAVCDAKLQNWSQLIGDTNDEETDAVRHFIFSAAIACSKGGNFASTYTTLHEGNNPNNFQPRDLMDITNNRVGIEWATKDCQSMTGNFDERVVHAALTQLQKKGLKTLRSGNTGCANPDAILRAGLDDLQAKAKKVNAWMKANNGICN